MPNPPPAYALQTHALTKRFPASERWLGLLPPRELDPPAVDAVSLVVEQGSLFGLLGPNGAGKTTFIKMLSTLIVPTSGVAFVNGFDLRQESAVKASIGLVTTDERSFYWRLTAHQNLRFFAALHDLPRAVVDERVEWALSLAGLIGASDKTFKRYSTGMRQRLSIARALLHEPKVLFLDEPTKGLDPKAVQRIHHLIREQLIARQGITVFMTTHWLEEAEHLCDRVAIMHHGRIRGCGTMRELRDLIGVTERYHLQVRGFTPALRAQLAEPTLQVVDSVPENPEDSHTLQLPKDENILNRIIDALRAAGVSIKDLRLQEIPLETIFSELTSGAGDGWAGAGTADIDTSAFSNKNIAPPIHLITPSPGLLRVASAFLQRDWHNQISYRFSFFLQFAGIFMTLVVMFFIARLVGDAAAPLLKPYGGDYFAFVLIGIAFSRYFSLGLRTFARTLRDAQTTGTLEAMLTTPARLSAVILSSSLWSYLETTVQVLFYIFVGVVFLGADLEWSSFPVALLILALTVFTFSSLGILAASFITVLKRGDPITWVFNALSALLGGVYFPFELLPAWLRAFSYLLPITYALRGMRLALIQGAPFPQILPDILVLAGFNLLLLPLSLLAFRYAVRRARTEGTLTHY